jgi:probable F420-dependent oxidoreductase
MKVDVLIGGTVDRVGTESARLEAADYDGVWTAETAHDPFLPLVVAAQATSRVDLGTSIAVAFARSPMTMAVIANDLQELSHGRLILGLGSQIQAHIERRFSMPWSHPAARMGEFVLAMRTIWSCWNHRSKLDFRGDFYTHTLMTPFFDPGPNQFGPPRVYLAGVGALMTEVAGQVCDGFICHSFTTEKYLREVTLPGLEKARATVGKTLDDFEISGPGFIVTGANDEQFASAVQATKQQIAFYGSTPAYRSVLELHGWGDVQTELNALSKRGKWTEMGDLIDDDMLETFAVVGQPDEIGPNLLKRYGDVVGRVSLYMPYQLDRDCVAQIHDDVRA